MLLKNILLLSLLLLFSLITLNAQEDNNQRYRSDNSQEAKTDDLVYRGATSSDITDTNNIINHMGFTIFYTPLNTMFFGNEYREDNHQVSLFNFGLGLDYYITKADEYISWNFGYQYYFIGDGLDLDVTINTEFMNHYFTNLTYTKVFNNFYIGLGLGYSYTYYEREFEEEEYFSDKFPKKDPGYYFYYYFNKHSSSLDLVVNFGMEVAKYLQIGFNSHVAMLFLRDQETDFSHKASMGLTFRLKIH